MIAVMLMPVATAHLNPMAITLNLFPVAMMVRMDVAACADHNHYASVGAGGCGGKA